MRAGIGLIAVAALAPACTDTPTEPTPTYTVGGMVSGLVGSGLVLRDNDSDDLPVSANGPVIFATPLASGAAYSVTVVAQPSSPAQRCTVTTGSGTMASANVTSVAIVCTTQPLTVGGTVSGLVGSGLVLRDNGGDDLAVSANGAFTFRTSLATGTAYKVTVFTQPTGPVQTCAVTGGNGTVASAVVTTVAIACTTQPFTVGGTVSGLVGSGLVLRDNGGDDLAVSANGSFTFATGLGTGAAYSVTVLTQPAGPAQSCAVTGGSGTLASANVTSVAIVCATNTHTVGGTVSGLVGSGLVLRDNGGDDLAVSANGPFTFATGLGTGAAYSVTVLTQPTGPAQSCAVTGGSGTLASANVTSVAIVCTTTHSVGGTVSGLAGSGLVLRNNGGDDLPVSANGPITFATKLGTGAGYSVTVFARPANPAQTCVVTDGGGTVASADITNVEILCTTNKYTVGGTVSGLAGSGLVLRVNEAEDLAVSANGAFSFKTSLASGTAYHVTVFAQPTGPAQTCAVTGGYGTVAGARVTTVAIACTTDGILRVTVATSGPDAPATYRVSVDPALYPATIPANGTVSFPVASGDHTIFLIVAGNCTVTGTNGVPVTVVPGASTDVAFSVTCRTLGTIQVTVATTGTDVPATFSVRVPQSGSPTVLPASVSSNGVISFSRIAGRYTVTLTVAPNCAVNHSLFTPNPRSVTVEFGVTTSVNFSVTCGPIATLRVTVATTGPNAPVSYTVGVDPHPGDFGPNYTYSDLIPSNGTVSRILSPGHHGVQLQVAPNCTVISPNPVGVDLTPGTTTDLAFTVACQ